MVINRPLEIKYTCEFTSLQLHSRETWLKEARQIKLGAQPYKMVKPRPKMKEVMAKIKITEPTLPVYGLWQTEPYIPPKAENVCSRNI